MPKKLAFKGRARGLKNFSFHVAAERGPEVASHLRASFARMVAPAGAADDPLAALDPESAARIHLDRLLASDELSGFSVKEVKDRVVEFKPIGSQKIPFTGTTIVKFRQFVDLVPVFGSFIAIELDTAKKNELVAVDSAITQLKDLPSAIAKASPAEAVATVQSEAKLRRGSTVERPRTFYYFDEKQGQWLLAYIVENAPAPAEAPSRSRSKEPPAIIRRSDYVINAQSGKLIQAVPRNFGAAASGNFPDELGATRTIRYDQSTSPQRARLIDDQKKVTTHDCAFADVDANPSPLPGRVASDNHVPAQWSPGGVSAHANAGAVVDFLRQILQRDSIDDRGAELVSSINCLSSDEPTPGDPQGWGNAFWNGDQMAYGQVAIAGGDHRSLAAAQDIVGHEIFHGVTERTSDLVYQSQSGALNESYSDIFGVMINNWGAGLWLSPNRAAAWDWLIGANLTPSGAPFRSMSDPSAHGQPNHFRDFVVLPLTRRGDMGGVHINSGIPNFCAFLILTSTDNGRQVFTADECAQLFYTTLTARLNRTADFAANRAALINSARSLFRTDPDGGVARVGVVTKACDDVGI